MTKFYRNLRHSWVINHFKVVLWYYRQRFQIFGLTHSDSCLAFIKPPFAKREYGLHLKERLDIFQALRLFSDQNAWNHFEPESEPQTIVDLGSNRGFSTLYWRSRFPSAQIHGVEMNANNVDCCRHLFEGNKLQGTFHQIAIADRDDTLSFRSHASHTRHRLQALLSPEEQASSYQDELAEVPCLTLASFLDHCGLKKVDLLKVDIEGAEQYLLETVSQWAAHVRLILLEIHHNIDVVWARTVLEGHGFEVSCSDESNRTEWICKNLN